MFLGLLHLNNLLQIRLQIFLRLERLVKRNILRPDVHIFVLDRKAFSPPVLFPEGLFQGLFLEPMRQEGLQLFSRLTR